ncbi:organic solute transporter subunit beta [Denticeps clupeoides]|uniref:organic solute transporter subunit beta n=1 Tax=Denticeps clupeoides TaxID=299321 RepID=UPI0010A32A74|nr:organic solute transporter subunit beta-like [Denticeps clupeoides]
MNEEQREYLRWFYRTEDQTKWTFAMLALSFAALLLGGILLVTGIMGSRSRKKIAKYKAAAAQGLRPRMEELQVISEECSTTIQDDKASSDHCEEENHLHPSTDHQQFKHGDVMVTWKDGNVTSLYPEGSDEQL